MKTTQEIKVPVTIPMPRFQGNAIMLAGQKWGWEMSLTVGQTEPICFGHKEGFEGYETKDEAISEMKKVVKQLTADLEEGLGAKIDGYLDLKKNEKVFDL